MYAYLSCHIKGIELLLMSTMELVQHFVLSLHCLYVQYLVEIFPFVVYSALHVLFLVIQGINDKLL